MANQNVNKNVKTNEIKTEDLEKALGTKQETVKVLENTPGLVTPPAAEKPADKPAEKAIETNSQLETLLKNLPASAVEKVRKLPAEMQMDIAKDYFAMTHPEGLASEFQEALKAQLPALIQKLAGEYLVSVVGKAVKVTFPDGEGTSPTVEMVDPKAVSGKKGGGDGAKTQWGESSVKTKTGETKVFQSPGEMGKSLGLLMKGWQFNDTTECFTKPYDRETGKQLQPRWKVISAEKGKGIHIEEI